MAVATIDLGLRDHGARRLGCADVGHDRRLQSLGAGGLGARRRAGCRRGTVERECLDGSVFGVGSRHSTWNSGALLVHNESIADMSSTHLRKAKYRRKLLLPLASEHD